MSKNDDLEGIFADLDIPDEESGLQDLDLEDRLFSSDMDLDDKAVGDGPDVAPSPAGLQEPVFPQPVNKATMVCLRGPCVHLWQMVARFVAAGKDDLNIKAIWQCNCHTEETGLNGQNIYYCQQWWPIYLEWVPSSLRGVLRPKLYNAYRFTLETFLGYDFQWKTWADDVFTADRPEMRGSSGPGGKRFTRKEDSLKGAKAPLTERIKHKLKALGF